MRDFASTRLSALIFAASLLASVATAASLFSQKLLLAEVVAGGAALLLALPVEVSLLLVLALADGFGSWVGIGTQRSMAIAVAIAILVAFRGLTSSHTSTTQRGFGLGVLALLAFGVLNGVTYGGPLGLKDLTLAAGPYLLLLLALAVLPTANVSRVLLLIAAAASFYSVLYLVSALTSAQVLPFIARQTHESFAGFPIDRIYAPGGLLPVYGLVWGVVETVAGHGKRRVTISVLVTCGLATLVTLSRSVLLGILMSVLVILFLLARRSLQRLRFVAIAVILVGTLAYTGGILNPRSKTAYAEISSGSGNFGGRLAEVRQRSDVVVRHPLFGVGFAAGDYDLSDSGAFTLLVRFGAVGAILVITLFALCWRRAQRLLHAGREPRQIAILTAGLLAFYLTTVLTIDALISAGGLALLGMVLGLFFSFHPHRRRAV